MIKKHFSEEKMVYYFKIVYLLMLMMGNTNLTFLWDGFDIINYVVGFLGIVLLILRIIRMKAYKETPGLVLLAALVVLYGVSSLWNYSYGGFSGLASNGKAAIWMACQMLLLYAFDAPSKEKLKKELGVMLRIILVFNFLSVLVSYGMLLTNFSKFEMEGDSPIMYGIVYNRLWGTFIDPNYGAVVAVTAILLSVHFFRENKTVLARVFHGMNILLSVLYVIYSDSRTGMVVLALGLFIYCFLSLVYTTNKFRRRLISLLACAAISFAVSAGTVASFAVLRPIGLMPRNACMQLVGEFFEKLDDSSDEVTKPDKEPLEIGRDEADINNDISNRRFDIWMSGLEILNETPVLGTTFRNLVPFAQKELPETYLVHNDNKIFWDLHNCLMNVLVCQGIPALLLFLAFAFIVLKKMLTYYLGKPQVMLNEQVLLVSVLLTIACGSMFNSMIMYVSTIETAVFWLFLGYGMQICLLEEKFHG